MPGFLVRRTAMLPTGCVIDAVNSIRSQTTTG
jgi:hypothetical protein